MPYNADGSWTSPKSGKTYGKDVPRSALSPEDDAALNEELQGGLASNPLGDGQTQPNTVAGDRVGLNAPGAQLDTSGADFQRTGLEGLLSQIQQQASTGSGSWENALKAATERSRNTASALGQSDARVDTGASLRNIGNAQAGADQRAVGQGNMLREQSKLDAQDQAGALTGSMGATDIEQATAAAGARQGVRGVNLQLKQDATKRNADYLSGLGQGVSTVASFGKGGGGGAGGGGGGGMSDGGAVPGQPKVFGDDSVNDVVPAKLTPKEVVLPLSVTLSEDPPAAAYRFMMSLASKGEAPTRDGVKHLAEGGDTGWKPTGQYTDAWSPGKTDPTGPKAGSFDLYGANGDVQAPSVENGALLDATQFDKTRGARRLLQGQLAERAAGGGPSVTPQLTTNANDEAISQALAARSQGATAAGTAVGGAAMAQEGGGDAAAQKAREQSAGQRAAAGVGTQAQQQELSFAQAGQRAAWSNTMSNLGISLANQATLRQLFSGAGQAATTGASLGSRSSGEDFGGYHSEGAQLDAEGERGGAADLGASDPEFKAHGGTVGYAGGGRVEGKYPAMPKPQNKSSTQLALGDLQLETDADRDAREYEEETGDKKPPARAKAGEKQTLAQQLAEFARKHLTAGASGMAEGGEVRGYSGESGRSAEQVVSASYQPPPVQPWLFGQAPTNSVRPGELPPELAAIAASAPPVNQSRYAPPQGPTSSVPLTAAEQAISRDMGAPQTVAHNDAVKAQEDRAARERVGIKPGAGPSSTGAPPIETPAPESRPVAVGVRAPPSHALEQGFATNQTQLANEQMGEALQQEARNEGIAAEEERKALEVAARDERETRERVRLNTQAALTKWQAATDEASKVDSNIDPGRFWAERTTGQKILGIIGLALGAAGTGPDGINKSAQLLNQAIDRDVDAQKARFEASLKKAGAKAAQAQTYYAMARDAGMDDLAATHAAKASALEAVAAKARVLGASTKEAKAKATMMGMAGLIDQAAIDKKKEAERWTAEFQQKNVALNTAATAANMKTPPGGAERAKIADEAVERAANIKRNAAELDGLIAQYGTQEKIEPGIEARMNQLRSALIVDSAKLKDPGGVVREPDEEREGKALGFEPGFWRRSSNARASVKAFAEAAEARKNEALKARGMAR